MLLQMHASQTMLDGCRRTVRMLENPSKGLYSVYVTDDGHIRDDLSLPSTRCCETALDHYYGAMLL